MTSVAHCPTYRSQPCLPEPLHEAHRALAPERAAAHCCRGALRAPESGQAAAYQHQELGQIRGIGYRTTVDRPRNRNKGIGWHAVHLAIDDTFKCVYRSGVSRRNITQLRAISAPSRGLLSQSGFTHRAGDDGQRHGLQKTLRGHLQSTGYPPHQNPPLHTQDLLQS